MRTPSGFAEDGSDASLAFSPRFVPDDRGYDCLSLPPGANRVAARKRGFARLGDLYFLLWGSVRSGPNSVLCSVLLLRECVLAGQLSDLAITGLIYRDRA